VDIGLTDKFNTKICSFLSCGCGYSVGRSLLVDRRLTFGSYPCLVYRLHVYHHQISSLCRFLFHRRRHCRRRLYFYRHLRAQCCLHRLHRIRAHHCLRPRCPLLFVSFTPPPHSQHQEQNLTTSLPYPPKEPNHSRGAFAVYRSTCYSGRSSALASANAHSIS
jgi:hypothetical protein